MVEAPVNDILDQVGDLLQILLVRIRPPLHETQINNSETRDAKTLKPEDAVRGTRDAEIFKVLTHPLNPFYLCRICFSLRLGGFA
jgi:hypothetical protein